MEQKSCVTLKEDIFPKAYFRCVFWRIMGQGEDVPGNLSQGKVSRMGEEILPRKQHLHQVQKLLSLIGQGFFPTFTIRILLLLRVPQAFLCQ